MVLSFLNRAETYGAKLRQSSETLSRDESVNNAYMRREAWYAILERYYANEFYDRIATEVRSIKGWAALPRNIRPISMVAKRAVDFWPGQIYPGAWTSDGLATSSGRQNRIPYDVDTTEEMRLATQQAFSWAGASRFLSRYVHLGAKLGNVFCEIEVHYSDSGPQGHKVYPTVIHPRHVVQLELNTRGDVKSYRLAVPMADPNTGRQYIWGKAVSPETVTTYWDDEPHSYVEGQPATVENPWGFVAAAWVPHQVVTGRYGAPAIDGIIPTLNEYQGILASVDDYLHKFVRQGAIIETKDPKGLTSFLTGQQTQGTATTPRDAARQKEREQQNINVMPAPEGTRVHHLLQNLGLSDADPHISRIAREIEDALPEIVFAERMQDMDQVTKPGAMALVSRVQQKLDDVAGNYDAGVIKLSQMCAAIGGHLAQSGEWGLRSQLTGQQQLFLPFDLTSYQRNELDFSLTPRELIPKSTIELAQEAAAIESLTTPTGLRHVGFSDEQIYGTDESGESLAPVPLPGILASAGGVANAAAVGDALALSFTRGLTAP